ncbi:HET-domain-containing protein [Ophiobolus disseminans]|uniref:HET-domain-containing protein n=1 Tax=Ophiobolus disseminans TaxID=1469910 RepID=A0A6A6ZGC6_9PLEO|nr:HET-domain-containing protein [Ophiobolus disseminans]
MPDDLSRTFAEIFHDPRDVKRQIAEVLPHIKARSYDAVPNFTFLAIEDTKEEKLVKLTEDSTLSESASSGSETSWNENKDGEHCRAYLWEDVEDPDLQLTLIRTGDPMHSTMKGYLAVSYCWPSSQDNTDHLEPLNLPVTIKEVDGATRPARALPHIIRRAIRHAADLGFKYIWLDQECINQNDPDEKEASIQCMDHVYRNARQVLCLLHLHISDQDKIDLLETLHYQNRHGVRGQFNSMLRAFGGLRGSPELATQLAGIMCEVAADRWFTRAWIMHERLCSSNLESTGVWATIASGLQSDVQGEVCILSLDQLEDAHEVAFRLENGDRVEEHQKEKKPMWEQYGKNECLAAARTLRDAIERFKAAFQLSNPAAVRRRIANSRRFFYNPLQITRSLSTLGCLYPSDKIAMLQNTCQWTKRLDTREVLNRGWSFSLCVWMLAIANGDGSFFCREDGCNTSGLLHNAWAPSAQTNISALHCSGLIDHVAMELGESGLQTQGWLWKIDRFIDLPDLVPVIEAIDRDVPETEDSAWDGYEFKRFPVEDKATKLKEFFWALLLKLSELKEVDVANLVWEAAKLRYRGGFYGRTLVSFPISTFDKIVDPDSGKFIGCYDSMCIPKEEEDGSYLSNESYAGGVISYLRKRCDHCRESWYLQRSAEECESQRGEENGDEEAQQEVLPENLPPPSHVLMGDTEQLAGIAWIRDTILNSGGLSIGSLVQGEALRRKADSEHDGTDLRAQERPARHTVALMDCRSSAQSGGYVYTLHREIRKYKEGDGKALWPVHSFDVWLKDAPSHIDAPFCWQAEWDRDEVKVRAPANVLFDIGGVWRMKYVLGWPDVYGEERWSNVTCS